MIRIGLLAILVVELLFLTIQFDSRGLDNSASPWLRLVAWSPQYLKLAITVAVVLVLLHARRVPAAGLTPRPVMSSRARVGCLAVHFAALYLFVQISSRIFGAAPPLAEAPWWVTGWFLVGATVLVSWGLAFLGNWPALSTRVNRALVAAAVGLGVLAWLVSFLSEALWRTFAGYTFGIVAFALRLIYDDVVTRPDRLVIGARGFRVNIAATCSGLEGVGLLIGFLGIYLWLFRRELRFPAALVLLPIGAVSIWLLNALRIVLLIVIGSSGWREIALGGFHSQAGWLTFNAVALGFVALVNRSGWFMKSRPEPESRAHSTDDPTAAYLAPFIVVLATAMVTGAFSSGFDWLYPLRVIAAGWVLWIFRRHYTQLGWSFSWRAVAIGLVTFATWIVLVPADPAHDGWPAALRNVPAYWAAAWMLVRVVGYTITVPLVEELAFRAYLTRRLIGPDVGRLPIGIFTWPSFVISSALFGVMHGSYWIAGTIAGMSFAVALYQRRALADAVVAHATTNGLIALYVLATGRWSVWS